VLKAGAFTEQALAAAAQHPKGQQLMSTTSIPKTPASAADLATGTWRLDPSRSSVEFHVRHFYGLMTVKGRFARYDATLNLGAQPAVQMTIDADSLDTKMSKRDAHLRSADFFDVEHHPQVRFVSDSATSSGDTVEVRASCPPPASTSPWSSTPRSAPSMESWRSRPSPKPTTASSA
jgi:polyisoprenoid-binding protein YceI